jgi:CRISPR-associated protein Cmr2
MPANWSDLLIAFLHDPPDKAIGIRGHEQRACRYLELAGCPVSREALHGTEDQLAAIIERLPMPHGRDGGLRVGAEDGRLPVVHPLSGQHSELQLADLDEAGVGSVISELVDGIDEPERRMLVLWRMLPEKLAERDPNYRLFPADTRVPDHTIWHHLETTAGLKTALAGAHGAALLSFFVGPVQPFIEAARSVRDLWTGSMILSWLSFQAMLPVIEELGPTAVIYPALRESGPRRLGGPGPGFFLGDRGRRELPVRSFQAAG